MATYWVSPTGGGNGSSSGSPFTLSQGKAAATQAGDIVNIMPGYYAETLNPQGSGSSNTNRITFQASDPNNKPVFVGSIGATTGSTPPPNHNGGWTSMSSISYSDGHTSGSPTTVYRKTGYPSQIGGVFVNHPSDGVGPTGYYSCLWMTSHQNADWNHVAGGGSNPDLRIHAATDHTRLQPNNSSAGDSDYFKSQNLGNTHYLCHDWQAQARWNGDSNKGVSYAGFPTDSLDIRLHSQATPAPSSYNIYVSRGGKCFDFSGRNYITFKNLIFRYWYGAQIGSCNGFTMDGCWMDQMYDYNTNIADNCPNTTLKNCRFIGAGPREFGADCIVFGLNCNNCLVDGCEIAWGGHGGLMALYPLSGLTVQNCVFHHCATALSIQSAKTGNVAELSTNITIQNNIFHDTGYMADRAPEITIRITPHAAIEFDSVQTGVIRRNLFYRVCQGILLKGYASSNHTVNGIDVRHNTVVDSQMGSMCIEGDGTTGVYNNTIRNNIFWGPSAGDTYFRANYVNGGIAPTVHLAYAANTFQSSNQFRNNLYYEVSTNSILPPATKGALGTFASILGGSGAANTNTTVWGPTSFNGLGSDTDPLFVNKGADNYGLQSGSPAIDKGQQINGETFAGTNPDLGYVEGAGGGGGTNPGPTIGLQANNINITPGTTVTFNANAADRDASGNDTSAALQYNWAFGDGGTASGTGFATNDQKTHVYNALGTFTCSCTVTDAGNLTAQGQVVISVTNSSSGVEITSGMTAVTSFGTGGADQASQTPDKLVDGFWASGSRGGGGGGVAGTNNWARNNLAVATPQGVIVDIGRAVTLTRVLVSHYPGGGGTRNYNYTLATSPTNLSGTYTDIGTKDTALNSEFSEIPFTQRTSVRYIKLTVNSASDGNSIASFWELRAYELTSSNPPPTVSLAASPQSGPASLNVNFTATATDQDATGTNTTAALNYAWDYGDGNTSSGSGAGGATRSHLYAAGNFTCQVTVTDAGGLTATDNVPITVTAAAVNNPPTVTLTTVPSPATITAGASVTFNASATDDSTSFVNLVYTWDFGDGTNASGGTISGNSRSQTKTYNTPGVYTASVTVADNGVPTAPAKSTIKQVTVTVNSVNANTWPLTNAFDNFNTPLNNLFGPGRTLNLKIVTDGDPSARWVAPLVAGQTYIGWDFGQSRVVKRLRVYLDKQLNGRAYNVTLQYSNGADKDVGPWNNFTGIVNVNTAVGVLFNEYVLGTAVNARFIRVVFNSSTNGCASCWLGTFTDN